MTETSASEQRPERGDEPNVILHVTEEVWAKLTPEQRAEVDAWCQEVSRRVTEEMFGGEK